MKQSKITTAYKCIRHKDGKLVSSQASNWGPGLEQWCVEYKIGEFVVPNIVGSKLMAFDTLENARAFRAFLPYTNYLYECEVTNARPSAIVCYSVRNIETFWKYRGIVRRKLSNPIMSYMGTIFCSSIKLVKLIQ